MNMNEYLKVKDLGYREYCEYLKNKYGTVPYKYGNKKNKKVGLFIHHIGEDEIASLSNVQVRKNSDPRYQEPAMLCYCDYLEHILLHNMIGREVDPSTHLGLNGPCMYIIPAVMNFYKYGQKNPKWDIEYYTNIENDKDVFDLLLTEYNSLIKSIDIVMDKNRTLYLEAKNYLDTIGRALVVLGTGLGKTTTALQYIMDNACRALVIGPNNLIKIGWDRYTGFVDTITYAGFANKYNTMDLTQYGLVILDEAHHSGYDEELGKGAKVWGKAIQYLFDNSIKVLGLTATPDRTDGIMLGESFFKDCTCVGRTVEEAVANEDIHPFDYITAVYDTTEITEELKELGWHEGTTDPEFMKLEGQIDIALNNTPTVQELFQKHMPAGKRKGIIFIQDIKDAEEVKNTFSNAFPNTEYRTLHSSMTPEEVKTNREWFENTDEGFLVAINMISEGAHYKGVNTLIMFRRTESYVLYSQQLGRIITLTKDENPHAIVFDLVNNINTIKYNDRAKTDDKPRLSSGLRKALAASRAAKSGQIIVKDYTQNIVERLQALKDYVDDSWEDWEIDILEKYYPTEGAEGCQRRIDEYWEALHPGSLTA